VAPVPELSIQDREDAVHDPELSLRDRKDAIPVPLLSILDQDNVVPVPELSVRDRELPLRGRMWTAGKPPCTVSEITRKGSTMAKIEGPKYTDVLTVDLTPVKDDLHDIAPNGLRGARAAKEGLQEVLTELAHAMPAYGDTAEIHASTYQRVVHATDAIATLSANEIVLMKLLEVCRESRTRLVNNREEDISSIAKQAEEKGGKGKQPELLAHFEKTIAYKSLFADKAVETRQKNEAAKAEAAAKDAPGAGASGPTGAKGPTG
jgi:hypothetical protein